MICTEPEGALNRRMRAAAREGDVPLYAAFELTRRCCFACVHCYAGPGIASGAELPTAEWLRLVDEAAKGGVLQLFLTGGEPMVRDDFGTIYAHACERGVRVGVFSNAALIDEDMLRLFDRYPPLRIDITVYGASDEVAARVTGVRDAGPRQWRGIERLHAAGIRIALKAVAMQANAGELEAIEARAARMGVSFRLSTDIMPRIDGDLSPLEQQLAPDDVVQRELGTPERLAAMAKAVAAHPADNRRYTCGTGVASFFIGADGGLQSCIGIRVGRESVVGQPLLPVWRRVRDRVRCADLPLAPDGQAVDNNGWIRAVLCPACMYDDGGQVVGRMWDVQRRIARARLARLNSDKP